MEKLSMCRICLSDDILLHSIVNTYLQEMYESLTKIPLDSYEDASDGGNSSQYKSPRVLGKLTPVAQNASLPPPPQNLPAVAPLPDASARALRALERAKRTIINSLE